MSNFIQHNIEKSDSNNVAKILLVNDATLIVTSLILNIELSRITHLLLMWLLFSFSLVGVKIASPRIQDWFNLSYKMLLLFKLATCIRRLGYIDKRVEKRFKIILNL